MIAKKCAVVLICIPFYLNSAYRSPIIRYADLDIFVCNDMPIVEESYICDQQGNDIATVCINDGVAVALNDRNTQKGSIAHFVQAQCSVEMHDGIIPWDKNFSMLLDQYRTESYLYAHLHTRKNPILMAWLAERMKKAHIRVTTSCNSDRDLLLDMWRGIVFTGQITQKKIAECLLSNYDETSRFLLKKYSPLRQVSQQN